MTKPRKNPAAVALGRRGGKASRAAQTAKQRAASAQHAANARWGKDTRPSRKGAP